MKKKGEKPMITANVTFENKHGLDLKPASNLAAYADRFDCKIHFSYKGNDINAKSILNLVAIEIRYGDTIEVCCDGPDEVDALKVMQEFMESHDTSSKVDLTKNKEKVPCV